MTLQPAPVSSVKPLTKSKMLSWESTGIHKPKLKGFRLVNGDHRYHVSFTSKHGVRIGKVLEMEGVVKVILHCLHGDTTIILPVKIESVRLTIKDFNAILHVRINDTS